jgi:hypothetical protein
MTRNKAFTPIPERQLQSRSKSCRLLFPETKKIVTITHVNNVLVQPHWRSHEELIKQWA